MSEAECYARLYGEKETTVTVIRPEAADARPSGGLLGEELRRRFEERLDAREPDELAGAEAA